MGTRRGDLLTTDRTAKATVEGQAHSYGRISAPRNGGGIRPPRARGGECATGPWGGELRYGALLRDLDDPELEDDVNDGYGLILTPWSELSSDNDVHSGPRNRPPTRDDERATNITSRARRAAFGQLVPRSTTS